MMKLPKCKKLLPYINDGDVFNIRFLNYSKLKPYCNKDIELRITILNKFYIDINISSCYSYYLLDVYNPSIYRHAIFNYLYLNSESNLNIHTFFLYIRDFSMTIKDNHSLYYELYRTSSIRRLFNKPLHMATMTNSRYIKLC